MSEGEAPGVLGEAAAGSRRRALGVLAVSLPYFSSGESSRQGKAGAAWGCRPTEHPLPTPAGNPAIFLLAAFRPARLLGKAGVSDPVGSPSRALHLPMRTSPQSVLRDPLIRGKSFDKLLAGKEAFGPKERGGRRRAGRSSPQVRSRKVQRDKKAGAAETAGALPPRDRRPASRREITRFLPGRPRDAQGMSATSGSANSQSASEQGGSAKRERALRTRLASSGGQLTKRTEQGARRAQARATCSGSEALVLTAENRQIFQDIPRRELSDRAQHDSAARPHLNAPRPLYPLPSPLPDRKFPAA